MKSDDDVTFKGLFFPLTTKKAIVFIFIIGFLIFFNGFFNGFVGDDVSQITDNINVHSISNIVTFFSGSTFYSGGREVLFGVYYKPVLSISYALIYNLFGNSTLAYHSLEIFLHIINASLLFVFFKRLFSKNLSFILSIIFLVHPINSEVAFYVSNLQDALFFFFGFSAILILQRYNSQQAVLFSSFLLLLSLLSKETGILFFITGLVFVFLYYKDKFKSLTTYLSLSFVLYLVLRVHAVGLFTNTFSAPIQKLNLIERIFNIPEMFLFYIKTFFFPLNLAVSYHWFYITPDFLHFVLPLFIDLIFLLVLTVITSYFYKRTTHKNFILFSFFTFWFLLGLAFHLQIIPLDATVADRWFYFPIVGLLGMIAVLAEQFRINLKSNYVVLLIILIISLLSLRTYIRSFDWKDPLTLARHDLTVSPKAFNLESGLGASYFELGNYEQAKIHAEKSIKLFPNMFNYTNLGGALFCLGDYKDAKKANLNALKYGQYYATYENLAGLSIIYGNAKTDINFIKNQALTRYPYDSKLWFYLAVLEYKNNMIKDAKMSITNAYLLDKGDVTSFVYKVITNNMPLQLKVKNGRVSYISPL